jgi:DtxR family Mn-dependent transcriptional regulator
MERDGLLLVAGDRRLELTEKGRALAVSVMRKHRLAERLLVDVIGLKWEKVHAEACRWEHVMSEEVERRLVKVLNNPTTSPYGNPIPGLALLGLDRPVGAHEQLIRLTDVPPGKPTSVVVRRLAEHVQSDPDIIGQLRAAGVVPDAHVTVETRPGSVTITVSGHSGFDLAEEMAHAVQVKQVPRCSCEEPGCSRPGGIGSSWWCKREALAP